MNIQPNWTVTSAGPWQLIYNDKSIISLIEVDGVTSTEGYVFAGTKQECEAEKNRLNLPWASDIIIDSEYRLIHKDGVILYYSLAGDESVQIEGVSFFGTYDQCEAEKNRLSLSWPIDDTEVMSSADGAASSSDQADSSQSNSGIISNTINFFKGLFG